MCDVLALPCKVCNIPAVGAAVCPQPIPVVCFVCATKPLSVEGVTEYIQSHNVMAEGFIMPKGASTYDVRTKIR